MNNETKCWYCDGHGEVAPHILDDQPCPVCKGTGKKVSPDSTSKAVPLDAEQEAREWLKSQPSCVGYPGNCDGDLVGTEHERHCPMFGKKEPTTVQLLASYHIAKSSDHAAEIERLSKERDVLKSGLEAITRIDYKKSLQRVAGFKAVGIAKITLREVGDGVQEANQAPTSSAREDEDAELSKARRSERCAKSRPTTPEREEDSRQIADRSLAIETRVTILADKLQREWQADEAEHENIFTYEGYIVEAVINAMDKLEAAESELSQLQLSNEEKAKKIYDLLHFDDITGMIDEWPSVAGILAILNGGQQ